jgi:hypothetical protein
VRRWSGPVAWLALMIGVSALSIRAGAESTLLALALPVVFFVVGWLLLIRLPGNRIAMLLMASAVAAPLDGWVTARLSSPPTDPGVGDYVLLVFGPNTWLLGVLPLVLLAFTFPTGQFPEGRWRWFAVPFWAMPVVTSLGILSETLPLDGEWRVDNPIGVLPEDVVIGVLTPPYLAALFVAVIGTPLILVARFRRAEAVERAQLKWVLFGLAAFAAGILLDNVGFLVWGEAKPDAIKAASQLAWLPVPVSMGVAILRYRLFEIDRLVSRTAGYAVVLSLLGLAYFGLVFLMSGVLPFESDVAVAASTLVVVGLFNPLRRRVQDFVDRRFFRSRYDAVEVVRSFTARLSGPMDGERLAGELGGVLDTTMRPEAVGVWIRGEA